MHLLKAILRNQIIRQQRPLLGLILLLSAIFILQALFGPGWYRSLMTVPAEITQAWSRVPGGDLTGSDLLTLGTLLTSAFLHGSIEHLLFNLVFLWIFAALVVELLGHRWMIAIFLGSAIAGSILHTVLNAAQFIPMLGASGAVMGFMGAYLGLSIRWQLPDPHIWPMSRPVPPSNLALLAIIGIALDVMGIMGREQTGIAYGAHVGGFLAGLFLTSFLVRHVRGTR
jgi:membrane associated rhomboid family serine protease